MAATKARPRGSKPDKIMRDAIMLALHEEAVDANGQMTTRARLLGRKLVDKAMDGDVPAIKEVNDRVDGKVPQAIVGSDDEPPIQAEITVIENVIVKASDADSGGVSASPETGEV